MHTSTPAPQSSAMSSFAAHFTNPLPRGLRAAGESASWEQFLDEYAPSAGPLRLGQFSCADERAPGSRLGPQARNYRATLAIGDTIATSMTAASGPVAALTAMLHECGVSVETTSFHQLPTDGQTATFIEGCDGLHRRWAMGLSDDPVQSALSAVVACANRLMTAA
ncbi:homocitrate synthase [Mycolicibacterium farcinogenes]|uniref:homocitrate synthase n=1 Tax=Mycolicibacterium farcinogenes TaxID=1802 RepID=UPI001C8DAE28|nr:homocitrate synthase [Mycolicibacterium farcinogenes]QZH58438.1 homocitrate synthase [Mycolicibacterium farcinogenes]